MTPDPAIIVLYCRTLKNPPGQGNYQLPTTPLPPGQVGVAVGEPPAIDSPPALEVSNPRPSSLSSPASSNGSIQQSPVSVTPKRVPGKLALCKWCSYQSEDLAECVRCRRKLDAPKILDDPSYKPKPDSTDANKKALRDVRVPNKNRRKNNAEEPLCIDIDSEDDAGEENIETETIEDDAGEEMIDFQNFCHVIPAPTCYFIAGNYRSRQKFDIWNYSKHKLVWFGFWALDTIGTIVFNF